MGPGIISSLFELLRRVKNHLKELSSHINATRDEDAVFFYAVGSNEDQKELSEW